jgi:hypothetical protein
MCNSTTCPNNKTGIGADFLCHCKPEEDKFDAAERFWLGPNDPTKHTVYKNQFDGTQSKWLNTPDGTILECDYSEFSVRIHDPKARSLSFVNRTIAILPKSRLRIIYKLIGEYLNEHDSKESTG